MKDPIASSLTRRRLFYHGIRTTGTIAAASMFPRPLTAMFDGGRAEPVPPIQDDRIKALVQRGIDAARSAGAQYSDVRMTHTRQRRYHSGHTFILGEREMLHVGVRALIDGYWGFAASPVWTADEVVRLGREAARQAKANTLGKVREIEMPTPAPQRSGHWETPVAIDPFQLNPIDIGDYLGFISEQLKLRLAPFYLYGGIEGGGNIYFSTWQQSKAFGATDGTYLTQRIIRSNGAASLTDSKKGVFGTDNDLLTPTGAGWEHVRDQSKLIDTVMQNVAYNREMARLPVKPVEVGRYPTIFDTKSVATLLSQSLGEATLVDRAFTYFANDRGTSYLVDPEEMLGTFAVGNTSLTVTANRDEPGGLATVQWDEEGIEPTPFTLIDRGVVTEFHTSREGAGWLKSRYEQLGRPFRSNGSSYAETANDPVGVGMANLVMSPDSKGSSYQDLEASMEHGFSVVGLNPTMDFQLTSGFDDNVQCFEIRKGKRVARVYGAGIMFRTQELWKSILAAGGKDSQRRYGFEDTSRTNFSQHSVTAVPLLAKDITFIDRERR